MTRTNRDIGTIFIDIFFYFCLFSKWFCNFFLNFLIYFVVVLNWVFLSYGGRLRSPHSCQTEDTSCSSWRLFYRMNRSGFPFNCNTVPQLHIEHMPTSTRPDSIWWTAAVFVAYTLRIYWGYFYASLLFLLFFLLKLSLSFISETKCFPLWPRLFIHILSVCHQ